MQSPEQGKSLRFWLAVLASALLHALSQAPWNLSLATMFLAAPVLTVLLDARQRHPARRCAAGGLAYAALATWCIVGPWAFEAAREWFAGSVSRAFFFTAALPLSASAVALPYAVAFLLISRLAGFGLFAGISGSAALWTMAEMARSTLGYGNPWASAASSLLVADAYGGRASPAFFFGALLSAGGPPALSLLASLVSASAAMAWLHRHEPRARSQALLFGAATIALALGVAELAREAAPARRQELPSRPLRVALVQSGIGGSRLWQSGGAAESFSRHVELTRSPALGGADLVVWPENALPFLLDANPERKQELRALARERRAALLVGGSHSSPGAGGGTLFYNSAFLFPADGSEPAVYDKRLLLPYVETLPSWAAPLLGSPWQGAFSSGSGPETFRVGDWTLAPLLCFEALRDADVAARVAAGADLIVNLSNDSWFDEGAGPEQHFVLVSVLAASLRRPLVRATPTGISGFVTEEGLPGWLLPRRGSAVTLLDIPPPSRDSFYGRGGRSAMMLLVLAIAVGAVLLPSIAGRRT